MENKELIASKLVNEMAGKIMVEPEDFIKVLKSSVLRPVKDKASGSLREATNEEFLYFLAVANKYSLNPFTKEIFAFIDTKTNTVVPIVSTDGWTKLMTNHPDYAIHNFNYSDKNTTLEHAKTCPEWCEIVIERKSGKTIIVREYLDEVYREPFRGQNGIIKGPWQTHTKRMLKHKTKSQGAREAFGFSGIYDEDEGTRIIESQVEPVNAISMKPEVPMPKAIEVLSSSATTAKPDTMEPKDWAELEKQLENQKD